MRERELFRNAVRFFTILPVGAAQDEMTSDWLTRCLKYSPLVGVGIGSLSAAVWLVANVVWGATIAALLAVIATIVITGALHEDGLADTIDGFGGGWSVEKRLTIMKDSRIGTYGALALGLGVALRVAALAMMSLWAGAAALIAVHAAARAAPAFVMTRMTYSGDVAAMKVPYIQSAPRTDELLLALVVTAAAAVPLALLSVGAIAAGWLGGAALVAALAMWARRLIGGYTGDVLGGIEQVFEIGFLLGAAAALS